MATMADILKMYGSAYTAAFGLRMLPGHRKTIADIIECRTRAKGGRVFKCFKDEKYEFKYHSCMNRHCLQCQNDQATKWLKKERKRLLGVPYFLVTFTLPQELRSFARCNQKLFYKLLFSESWGCLKKLAANPKWLGGKIGALGILHTWTKAMSYHPHVHYLIPAGCIAGNDFWMPSPQKFFLPVHALSRVFRAMMRDTLRQTAPEIFSQIPAKTWRKGWVVHSMVAGNGHAVLKYFAPYVFRVAISNKRILSVADGQVVLRYKNSATGRWASMTVSVFEFIRRFLQHVLPKGFKKVRHFGFLSPRNKALLALLQYKLGTVEVETEVEGTPDPDAGKPRCPVCHKVMVLVEIVPPVCPERSRRGGFDRLFSRVLQKAERARVPCEA